MTRIDSATITLDWWDAENGQRHTTSFPVDLRGVVWSGPLSGVSNDTAIRQWWAEHSERIRLAAKDEPGPFIL